MRVLSMAIGFLFSLSDGRLHSYFYSSEKTRSCPCVRGYACRLRVMIGILLLKNGNRTVAAARVDSFSRFVIEHVVAVADSRKLLNDLSCTRVEDEQACRHSRHNEEPVLAFVKGHGIVGKCH